MPNREKILTEMQDLVPRVVVMVDGLENIEHRISILIEGQRQQLDHVVGTLRIREMQAEMRHIRKRLDQIYEELKALPPVDPP